MQKKSEAVNGLRQVFQEAGVPHTVIVDNAKEEFLGEFRRVVSEAGSKLRSIEPYSPWQNSAEGAIRELKKATARAQAKSNSPKALWDHCIELQAHIRSRTAHGHPALEGQVPETIVTGQTADISPYVEHGWYEWVYAISPGEAYPDNKEILGRWLGPTADIGPAMCSKILKRNGQVLYTSSYRALNEHELTNPDK